MKTIDFSPWIWRCKSVTQQAMQLTKKRHLHLGHNFSCSPVNFGLKWDFNMGFSYLDAQQHCIPVHHNKLEDFHPSLFRRSTHSTPQSFLDLGYFSGAYFHGYRIYGHWASPGSSSSLHYPQHLVLFPWKNTKRLSLQSLNIQVCLGWEAHGFLFGIRIDSPQNPAEFPEKAN